MHRFRSRKFKKVFIHDCRTCFCADLSAKRFQMFCHKRNEWFNVRIKIKLLSRREILVNELTDIFERSQNIGTGNQNTSVKELNERCCNICNSLRVINCTRIRFIKKKMRLF